MKFEELQESKGRKFVLLNVRSLLPNINLIRHDFELSNYAVIGINETWLNQKIPDPLVSIKGFNLLRSDRKGNKRGGGLILYINDNLEFESLPDHLNFSNQDLEMLSVLIKPSHQKDFFYIFSLYPPVCKQGGCN